MIEAVSFPILLAGVGTMSVFLMAWILVITQSWHGRFSMDNAAGVQKVHLTPTPRIGGVALLVGLLIILGLLQRWSKDNPALLQPSAMLMGQTLLASMPAFMFGLIEDITKRISVRIRLFATIGSGLLAWWLTDYSLNYANTWGLDFLLSWLPFSVLFTAFCVGGIANAINIVDGFNGLSSGILVIAFASVAWISAQVGDMPLMSISLAWAGLMLGFGLVNFPFGKIFLGDGGAYTAGFFLAWLTVMLPMRNPDVSVWTGVLICGYPTWEVFASIWRRHQRAGHHPGQPDRYHMHHLIFGRWVKPRFKQFSAAARNGMTSPPLWLCALVPCTIAMLAYRHTGWLVAGFILCGFLYRWLYLRLLRFRWCL